MRYSSPGFRVDVLAAIDGLVGPGDSRSAIIERVMRGWLDTWVLGSGSQTTRTALVISCSVRDSCGLHPRSCGSAEQFGKPRIIGAGPSVHSAMVT